MKVQLLVCRSISVYGLLVNKNLYKNLRTICKLQIPLIGNRATERRTGFDPMRMPRRALYAAILKTAGVHCGGTSSIIDLYEISDR